MKNNKLNILKINTLTILRYFYHYLTLVVLFLHISCSSETNNSADNYYLQEIEDLTIYTDNTTRMRINNIMSDSIIFDELSEKDKHIYIIEKEMLKLTKYKRYDSEIQTSTHAEYFVNTNNYKYACKTFYILGYQSYFNRNFYDALSYWKQAEFYMNLGNNIPDYMKYRIYNRISYVYLLENIYDMAEKYALLSLKSCKNTSQSLFHAQTYRNLMVCALDERKKIEYRDSALMSARAIGDSIYSYEVQIQYAKSHPPFDSISILNMEKELCTKTGYHEPAFDVAEYYLSIHNLDSAKKYINIFSKDSLLFNWKYDQFLLLNALYLKDQDEYEQAFNNMVSVYDTLNRIISKNGNVQLYNIQQKYDNEWSENQIHKLERKRLMLIIYLSICIIGLLIWAIIAIILFQRNRKHKRQKEEEERLAEIEKHNKEIKIQEHRKLMYNKIRERLMISKKIRIAQMQNNLNEKDIPNWAKDLIAQTTFTNKEQWNLFLDEYNAITGGEVDNLHISNPYLTETDIQYIVLAQYLQLSVEDICILLNCTPRTIWNRKQMVAKKIERQNNKNESKYNRENLSS